MKKLYQSEILAHYDEHGNYDDNEIINPKGEFWFNAKYVVCHECNGHGTHFRRDLDENALVQSMIDDGDEDGIEMYHGGSFDELCHECKGNRVVLEYEFPEWANEIIRDYNKWERINNAIRDAERRVGA